MTSEYKGEETMLQALESKINNLHENLHEWEKPTLLETNQPMEFNPDWLPAPLGEYAFCVAESVQVPVDMAAISILTVLSLCNSKNYIVQVNQDHFEPLNLFCVIVADPSERKSSVLREVTSPISDFEEEENQRLAPDIARSITRKKILQKEVQFLQDKAVKNPSCRDEAISKAIELDEFEEVRPKRYLADDVTMEKLTSLLYENNGKIGIFSGEGQIFSVFSGQYSKKENFDVVLKAYSGESIRVDRLGRSSEYIKNPALTMLLAVQPSVLDEVINNKNFQGRGLVGRILFSLPTSKIGHRKYDTVPIPVDLRNMYKSLIKKLINKDTEKADVLRLSAGSNMESEMFFYEIESRLIGDMYEVRAFGGKLVGLVNRIAGNLHIAKYPDDPGRHLIEVDTMRAAIEIGRYAISHTFRTMEGARDSTIEGCRYITGRISEGRKRESITKREIMRLCQRYKNETEINPFIEKLIEYGYLEPVEEDRIRPGRPSEKYLVNPYLFNEDHAKPQSITCTEDMFQSGEILL
ncbi:MAG: YfjI family protein [Anaerovoracaceae bacterium]